MDRPARRSANGGSVHRGGHAAAGRFFRCGSWFLHPLRLERGEGEGEVSSHVHSGILILPDFSSASTPLNMAMRSSRIFSMLLHGVLSANAASSRSKAWR